MLHRRTLAVAALFTAAAFGTACNRDDPVSPPASSQLAKATGTDTSTITNPAKPAPGTPSDTATHGTPPVTPPPPDSGGAPYTGTVTIHGQVVTLRPPPAGSSSDTLVYQVVPGTAVSLIANGSGQTVGTATSGSDGSFTFSVPAGAYRISGHAPTGSGASDGSILVSAEQAVLYVQLLLPKAP